MSVHVDGIVAIGDGIVDIDVDSDCRGGRGTDVYIDVVLDRDVSCID